MITEITPVVFENRNKVKLVGTLYKPKITKNKHALILINPGVKGRVGPQRLYIKIANLFVARGFGVLRLDAAGLGDSEGIIREELTREFFLSVEQGRLVNDVEDAIDWLSNKHGFSNYIIGGLCGGAISALLTAFTNYQVKAILGLGLPVSMEKDGFDNLKNFVSWYINFYKSRIFHGSFWHIKLLNKNTYQLLLLVLDHIVKKIWKKTKIFISTKKTISIKTISEKNLKKNEINPLVLEALRKFSKNRKVLLIYGENDKLYWELKEYVLKKYFKELILLDKNVDIHIIKNANHEVTLQEWKEKMFIIISEWLESLGFDQLNKNNEYVYVQ